MISYSFEWASKTVSDYMIKVMPACIRIAEKRGITIETLKKELIHLLMTDKGKGFNQFKRDNKGLKVCQPLKQDLDTPEKRTIAALTR